MKNDLFKKALPHVIAVLVFLLVSVIFCKPAIEGKVLNQHDIVGWKGMAQNAFDYKEKNGHFPLWNTNVFSGMPNYLIAMEGKSVLPDITKIITLALPQPINFFFLACICFYILCLALRLKPIVGIFGAIAFAFATYNPIIIAAGHVTKMFAIAYMPLLLAGILLIYDKRYWIGLALATLGTYLQVGSGHPQISYYLFILAGVITIPYLVQWIRQNDFKHIGLAIGFTAVSVIVGLTPNMLSFLTTQEYSKATIRGGKAIEINGDQVTAIKNSGGLDTSYAFEYSLGKGEVLTTLMPNSYGGSLQNLLDENSKVVSKLVARGVPENNAVQIAGSLTNFWGDPKATGGGPLYAGAIVCILALLGFVLYKKPLRWGLLAVSLLAMIMSWGKFFPGFNLFLFENLPFYNKFRAPSITMVIVQLTLPLAAVLGLQLLIFRDNSREALKADFKKILYTMGGLIALLLLFYIGFDYSASFDKQILANKWDASGTDEIGRLIVSGLKEDRQSMFGAQVIRTIGFIILVLGLLWMHMKNVLKPGILVGIFAFATLVDQLVVDKKYLGEELFVTKDESTAEMTTKTAIDQQLLADKDPHFRVFDYSQGSFSAADYHAPTFHRTVGGYHPAKLRLYNDIIERYLGGPEAQPLLNMLDVKYIIARNPQNGQEVLIPNPDAYGAAWLVKNVKLVKDDVEELQSLGKINLKDTAVVQQSLSASIVQPQWDSTASITLVKYDNDAIEYSSSGATPQFAVFSEIYYPFGWNAYIDDKKVDYVKTNYAFRGLSIPAGKHAIRFVFEPSSYKTGNSIGFIGSILILVFVIGGFYLDWKSKKTKKVTANA